MISGLIKKVFGSRNDRLIRQYSQKVRAINALEPQFEALSDDELRAKTDEFRQRLADGAKLDDLLIEAFAVVREAGKRVHGMRHFDVQLVGGMVLHDGRIAEMKTGEGKTLVATLPAYLNALAGNGVHIITVNDYLASRDAEWMGRIYGFLGLTTGCNLSRLSHTEKQAAYGSDITYGTNNEFGFDYLRDNMVYSTAERVQRGLSFAIVDEVDSILIDEARTPLIISGQAEDHTELYLRLNEVPPKLTEQQGEGDNVTEPGDYTLDLKARQVLLTEEGHEKAEQILSEMGLLEEGASLYDASNIMLVHHLYAALRAHALFHKDQHYVVQDGEVVIVDEFTGRLMSGRRWSDGLHQAVEAKEGVKIQAENQTLASITFQNYFRMYAKLAGMTGTADTEAYEFHQIYGLETVIVPTNRPMQRRDGNDKVYRTAKEKWDAVIADIRDCVERGQPVLVGTTSIEVNEFLSGLLKREKIPHQLLNAKQHDSEAQIVAQAGRPGVVTIATNMAGRGTDIVLGGNIEREIDAVKNDASLDEAAREAKIAQMRAEWQKVHDAVIAAGGLHIIGTERHESRRIDNQLRGRAGRQGDPGSSRFYLSLEDPLMKIFAGDRLNTIMVRLKMPEGEAIEHGMVTRSLESAQRKVEQRNFDIRKQLLEYDDVANDQRKVVYEQRNELLSTEDISETITAMRRGVMADTFRIYVPEESVEEQWDIAALETALAGEFQLKLPVAEWLVAEPDLDDDTMLERIIAAADEAYAAKTASVEPAAWHQFERHVMLQSLDTRWRDHLAALDQLRQGIHLRGYAQKNPKQEYKRESFELFEALLDSVRTEVTKVLMTVQVRTKEELEEAERQEKLENVEYRHAEFKDEAVPEAEENESVATGATLAPARAGPRVGRNDACPCGSGKKYKHCHGKLA
ncbi:preprotein translocase subunit SecA [Pseudazoarcus pumilus]|uniref:Protein translocase subunit SecA n=1 Tax=Pseudazoarcus pumilus TaxID=2067960 RepID=A0A2I6S8R1_9RHOO|nr:preprotein translocase subunit SecA [Pseudazoarcus pumilus]AUN95627.1 preprotein translocase subunit SecA [Pseudazoarcus pumilus]